MCGYRVSAPCARKESARKLARHVGHGRARIRSATLTHQGGRWCCSLSVEITRTDPPALVAYQRAGDGWYEAYGVQVLTLIGARIARITAFNDPSLVPTFGLAPALAT
jgi:hypothetical protein